MDSDAETVIDVDEESVTSLTSSVSTELFDSDNEDNDDGVQIMEVAEPEVHAPNRLQSAVPQGNLLDRRELGSNAAAPNTGGVSDRQELGATTAALNIASVASLEGIANIASFSDLINRLNETARTSGSHVQNRTGFSQGPGNQQQQAVPFAAPSNSSLSQPTALGRGAASNIGIDAFRNVSGTDVAIRTIQQAMVRSDPLGERVPPPLPPQGENPGELAPQARTVSTTQEPVTPSAAANSNQTITDTASDPGITASGNSIVGDGSDCRDSLGDFKLPVTATEDKENELNETDSDDESQTCIICYEPWSNSGKHRLASLKCGHIFGQSCIQKWLKGQKGKCPQCNAKAKKSDIRVIYAKALKAIDTSERDKAIKDLEREKELRRKIEIEKAQMALKYQMAMEEVNRIKSQVKHQSSATCSAQPGSSKFQGAATTLPGFYILDKTISVSADGNSRVLAYDYANHALIASVPSPNQILFSGYGVKKISALMDWKANQYVPIHSKPIRGMGFNGRNDGLLLTGAMDKTLKITSLSSNTVVQMYNTCSPVWSCCWNEEDVNYLFAGLSNGTIVIYDTRNTSEEVLTLNREGSRHPIVAMNYVPSVHGSSFNCSGLLVGTLSNCSFWEQTSPLEFKPSILPLEGNCISLSFEPQSRHCLASFRPNKSCPSMRHVMCELLHTREEGQTEPGFKCNPMQSFFGGSTVKLLARSAIFRRPNSDSHLLIAAGDEATSSLDIWDGSSGKKAQHLITGATVVDMAPFRLNNIDYLAALSEKVIKLYKWQV